jgi:hypothetical protein
MSALAIRIAAFIDRCADGSRDDATRDHLLAELTRDQAEHVTAYRRFLAAETRRPSAFERPALPTDVFRFARVARHVAAEDVRLFRTSGTTAQARGEHALRDLTLYDRAAYAAARYMLFPDRPRMQLCVLAPEEHAAPDSSLSYMLARFGSWFGDAQSRYVWRDGRIDCDLLAACLRSAEQHAEPIALLGTSFAFVHADEAFGSQQFALPPGSRIMQTGGFKGRSRTLEPAAMLELLSARYGIDPAYVVQEYGMTELSSQCYETPLRAALLGETPKPRQLWVPGWMRAVPIDPNTLEPTPAGQAGLLRIDDLANLDSVCAIQTSDLALREGEGILLLGRAPDAVARGCSLAVEEWLEGAT